MRGITKVTVQSKTGLKVLESENQITDEALTHCLKSLFFPFFQNRPRLFLEFIKLNHNTGSTVFPLTSVISTGDGEVKAILNLNTTELTPFLGKILHSMECLETNTIFAVNDTVFGSGLTVEPDIILNIEWSFIAYQ